jgi:hypothetical protein
MNSIKHAFGPKGGRIKVRLVGGIGYGEAPLTVTDNGCGVQNSNEHGSGLKLREPKGSPYVRAGKGVVIPLPRTRSSASAAIMRPNAAVCRDSMRLRKRQGKKESFR